MLNACGLRAISNGMVTPTLFPWRPALVHERTPVAVFSICVRSRFEPAMRCIAPIWRVTLCADVACLAWSGWMRDLHGIRSGRNDHRDRPLKPVLQKRLKKRTDCGGKHLGCSLETDQGLQCGLSGNRVAHPATVCRGTERGTASIGNEGCSVGKTDPHLSRKIYLFRCRCLSNTVKTGGVFLSKPSKQKKVKSEASRYGWAATAFFMAVLFSGLLSLGSETVLNRAGLVLALAILLFFICLGILFDIIGVAVTSADEKPFHSMAAHRERGAKEALRLLKNADRVSSICNDVVGDICGIVSGATSAVIVARLQTGLNVQSIFISVGVTALVSGLTIGGKAMCKPFAIKQSKQVVYWAGRFLHLFHRS